MDFFFGVSVSEKFVTITDTLSKAVQRKSLCAVEAQTYATVTLACLKEERNDEHFNSLWVDLLTKCSEFGVEESTLPRKRRTPNVTIYEKMGQLTEITFIITLYKLLHSFNNVNFSFLVYV